MEIVTKVQSLLDASPALTWHDIDGISQALVNEAPSKRQLLRALDEILGHTISSLAEVRSNDGAPVNPVVFGQYQQWLTAKRFKTRIVQLAKLNFLVSSDLRGHLSFCRLSERSRGEITSAINLLEGELKLIPHGTVHGLVIESELREGLELLEIGLSPVGFEPINRTRKPFGDHEHLRELEQESIYIIREAVAAAEKPGMLFSLGKDSMVMLRLAEKAFAPGPIPFPLVNIDTRWKFQEMNRFREWVKARADVKTIHYVNPDAIEQDVNPFDFGSATHTDITKTQALKKLLNEHQFDFVFGGARRDEEKSRAKERVFSVRDKNHSWDPRNQRPELWDIYNTTLVNGQSMRVFPLSNWTEIDIWRYLDIENVPLVPLYFAKRRPYVHRNGSLIMVDDERFQLEPGEEIEFEPIRFRSLGCYPLSGGVKSSARTVSEIVTELESTRVSERSSRVIDFDRGASMEQKKKEGYF
jgi:sulfate adenylyltransferase subunit 2